MIFLVERKTETSITTDNVVGQSNNTMTSDATNINECQDLEAFKLRMEQADALPSIPTVVVKLLQILRQDDCDLNEVARLISQDSGLTARLLKLANSAAMGLRVQVTSIQRAVPLLGNQKIRQICLGGGVWDSLAPIAEKAQFNLEAFEKHSLTCAAIAQELAARLKLPESEDVYAAALLHDIGKFLLLAYDGQEYAGSLNAARNEKSDLLDIEYTTIGWTHPVVGGWLGETWSLPPAVVEVIKWHHQPERVLSQPHGKVVALVAIANNLAKVLKSGDSGNPAIMPIGTLLGKLQIKPDLLKEVGTAVKQQQAQPA